MIRLWVLKILSVLVGLALMAGIYPLLNALFHRWNISAGDQMILGIYFPIGIFLLLAAGDSNRTLILCFCVVNAGSHRGHGGPGISGRKGSGGSASLRCHHRRLRRPASADSYEAVPRA
jgi:hypothetical protein